MEETNSSSLSSQMFYKYIGNKDLSKLLIFDNWSATELGVQFEQLCILHNKSSNQLFQSIAIKPTILTCSGCCNIIL